MIVVGGELSLDMLDMSFNTIARFYEAPLHMKATNGVLLIDDFGRQRVEPKDLLNRWIVPLEKRVDYLTLHTGKTFQIPFDELLVFSTNLNPESLMDDAFLRRIPYKIEIDNPSQRMYEDIFRLVCRNFKLALPDDLIPFIHDVYYSRNGKPLASHHPNSSASGCRTSAATWVCPWSSRRNSCSTPCATCRRTPTTRADSRRSPDNLPKIAP